MRNRGFVQRTDEITELTYRLGKKALRSLRLAEDATTMTNPGSSSDQIEPMGWTEDESKKEPEETATGKPEVPPPASETEQPAQGTPQLIEVKINPQTRDVDVNYVPSPDEILADVPGAVEEGAPEKEVVHEPKKPQEFEELNTSVGF